MEFWPKPTPEEIKFVVDNIKGNLKFHFFSKLENPEWFCALRRSNTLWYEIIPGDSSDGDSYSWPALSYLIKITPDIPEDVYEFLLPLIDKMKHCTIETFWFVQLIVFSIAPKMPDTQFISIMSAFVSYLEQVKTIGWFDAKELYSVFQRLYNLNSELADRLTCSLLMINLEERGEHGILVIESKYGPNNDYRYSEVLKIIKQIYENKISKLFDVLVDILGSYAFKNLSKDYKDRYEFLGYIHRPAIEEHPQNHSHNEVEDLVINAIRDIAIEIAGSAPKQMPNILSKLEQPNSIMLRRIAIHLLSVLDGYDGSLLAKYLTDYTLFNESEYHHEYFHFIRNKFDKLSLEHQNMVLAYIENGPTDDYYNIDDKNFTAVDKQRRWKFDKLVPILDKMTDVQKERFISVIYDSDGNPLEAESHPDFLTWTGHFESVIHKSPIDTEDIKDKSIYELIEFMDEFKPSENNWLNGTSRQGLAKVIQEDIKQNPKKYILELDALQSIAEPTYVRAIIRGILESGIKEDEDWIKLIKFCETILIHDENFEGRDPFHDGDDSWYWAKQEVVSVFSAAFREKNNLSGVDSAFLEGVYKALKMLVEAQDENLEKKRTENIPDRLHTAINSLHGQAVEALLIYVLWLKNNDKPREQIFPLLNKLTSESRYLETGAIIARMISYMDYAIPEWVVANIDNIFPTEKGKEEIFKATWHAFILYGRQCNSLFERLETKFAYALSADLWDADEGKRIRERTAQGLAYYYGWGAFTLDSFLLGLIFNSAAKQIEQVAFINYIGFSLWDRDGRGDEISNDVLVRFTSLWEWFIEKIKDHRTDYKKVLVEFERWYQCGRFKDGGWAINQLHILVMDDELKLTMSCFMLEDNLLEDLQQYPRKVFDIISRLVLRGDRSDTFSKNDIVEKTLEFIKNNDFPDDILLKSDKDSFINKMLEQSEAWELEQKEKLYRKYLEIS